MTRWKPSRMSPNDDRPRAAARAQDDGLLRHLLSSDQRSSATLNPATSVLWPMRRLPSRVIVLTAPVDDASSVRRSTIGTTRSLCGIVTLAPRKSSVRSSATASARSIGARSHSS